MDQPERAAPLVAAKVRLPEVRALPRERLHAVLARIWEHRLGLVVAPAGSGKTTLLAQFAATLTVPVAWYRPETSDGETDVALPYLEKALCAALAGLEGGWRHIEDAALALERWPGARALLVVDDVHVLRGSPAERLLEQLVGYAPPTLGIIFASRASPGFDLTRLRVAGQLLEIRADDLRFRTWEVERLFQEIYRERFPPEALAEVARRTEGWAAGLQLFHLATRRRRPDERRGVLAGLNTPVRLVREYLTRNVLDQQPARLRRFLLDSCVLGRLSGPLCDELLGRSGSAELLEELASNQIFTSFNDLDGTFRYHEVLRSHLSAVLVEEVGELEARRRHRRAGAVLEAAGAVHDALSAYCRGEDWPAVARLLGHEGEQLALDPGEWLDLLPSAIRDHDPWTVLATARRWRGAGRWPKAVEAYRRTEELAGERGAGHIARRERLALRLWLEPPLRCPPGWVGLVRQATRRDPRSVLQQADVLGGVDGLLAGGLASLLAGDVRTARTVLSSASRRPGADATAAAAARLAAGLAAALAGDPGGQGELEGAVEDLEALGTPWLGWLGHVALGLYLEDGAHRAVVDAFDQWDADPWGRGLSALVGGLRAPGEASEGRLAEASRHFDRLGAGVLQTWCLSLRAFALARQGTDGALAAASDAEARARALGVPGAQALASAALAHCQTDQAGAYRSAAHALADECGLALPGLTTAGEDADGSPAVVLRCFGAFELTVDGQPVDFAGVRLRVRALLHLLALHAGRGVHREVILEALWPDTDAAVATRGLHVAVSTLRSALPTAAGVGVLRDGDAYRLRLPAGTDVDVVAFEQALAEGHRAAAAGQGGEAVTAWRRVLAIHDGDLLPEEGPADWVVGHRERYRSDVVAAAESLARALLASGEVGEAAVVCARGLELDRYRDTLWQILIGGLQAHGNHAAAERARQRYGAVLDELGLSPPPSQLEGRW